MFSLELDEAIRKFFPRVENSNEQKTLLLLSHSKECVVCEEDFRFDTLREKIFGT